MIRDKFIIEIRLIGISIFCALLLISSMEVQAGSSLVAAHLKFPGDGNDDRADFNVDGVVNISDISLLSSNFGLYGALPVASVSGSTADAADTAVDVSIEIVPASSTVKVGDIFSVSVMVKSDDQQVDGVEVHLNFDLTALQVTKITGNGEVFPLVFQTKYNNTIGTLDYAAGTFSGFPSGNTTVATVEMKAIKEIAQTDLEFAFQAPRITDVTFDGESVLTQHQDGSVTILPGQVKILLPVVKK